MNKPNANIETGKFPPILVVVIQNQSGSETLRVWKDNNSAGYLAATIEIESPDKGRVWTLKRRLRDWTVDRFDCFEIPPGASASLSYDVSDGSWIVPQAASLSELGLRARVILNYNEDELATRWGVFTGTIVTEWQQVTFNHSH